MKPLARTLSRNRARKSAFLLLEATIGMALMGMLFMALYTGLCTTTFFVKLSRENLRATQLMAERLDTIRLYGWKKIVDDPTYIQQQRFYPPIYSDDPTTAANDATTRFYTMEFSVDRTGFTESYADDLRVLTVKLSWVTGKMVRSRSMSTLIARDGVNTYVSK